MFDGKLRGNRHLSDPGSPYPYVLLADIKAANTAGGTFTAAALRTRVLTYKLDDSNIFELDLNTNRFWSKVSGIFRFYISAPALNVGVHQACLWNITTNKMEKEGTSEYSNALCVTRSLIVGKLPITAGHKYEIQHICGTTGTTTGFGIAVNAILGGIKEVYTVAEFQKVG